MKDQIAHHPKFDMLRGVAAILVLTAHVIQAYIERFFGTNHPFVQMASTIARHAVLIFFLLSGYLITVSIIANIRRHSHFDVIGYLSSRVSRIHPPLIGAIIVVLVCWTIIYWFDLPGKTHYGLPTDKIVVRDSFVVDKKDIIRALIMMGGLGIANGPLWSLYIEFHIYIIAMFIALSSVAKNIPLRVLWALLGTALFGHWVKLDSQFAFFTVVWLAGSLTAIILNIGKHKQTVTKFGTILLVCFTVLLVSSGMYEPRLLSVNYKITWINYSVQFAFCYCYLYMMFISKSFDGTKPGILVFTGSFSYSLYIIHFPVLLLIYSFTQNWMGYSFYRSVIVSGVAMIIAISMAVPFARFFENQRIFKPWIHRALSFATNWPIRYRR